MPVTHQNSAVVSCMHFGSEPNFLSTDSALDISIDQSRATIYRNCICCRNTSSSIDANFHRAHRSLVLCRTPCTSFLQLSFEFHPHPWSMPLFSTSTTALLVNSTPLLRLQCENNKEPGTVCLTCSPTPNNWRSSLLHIARTRRTQPQ